MNQEEYERVHVTLFKRSVVDLQAAAKLMCMGDVSELVMLCVECCIETFEENYDKRNYKLNGRWVNTLMKRDDMGARHIYYGGVPELMDRLRKVALKHRSVSYLMRLACAACTPAIRKAVERGKDYPTINGVVVNLLTGINKGE